MHVNGASPVHPFGSKVLSALLAIALAFGVFVSTLCVAELFEHDCAGDDCDICHVLEISEAVLTSAAVESGAGTPMTLAATAFMLMGLACCAPLRVDTPVSLKVRIDI